MGGVNDSRNFILNCEGWKKFAERMNGSAGVSSSSAANCSSGAENGSPDFYYSSGAAGKSVGGGAVCGSSLSGISVLSSDLGIAPVTGAVQNIGFENEADFYLPYFSAAKKAGISICVGDGAPDEKLELGLAAVRALKTKAFFFLKPYPDEVLRRRIDLVRGSAIAIGYDIDAYNIVTMRNQVSLEKKTASQLSALREYSGLPLMIKGVFTAEDVDLCRETRPEIVVVSNHGGRVETREGNTAEFLAENASLLKECCREVWVDGGIRTAQDVKVAKALGAHKVLIARSFISALCRGGESAMEAEIKRLFE